jgi:adenine-specific DNA-methyltransferase
MESVDMTEKNIDAIGALFPNCITESRDENGKLKKAINFEMLRQMLSEDIVEGDEAYEFTWVGKKAAIVEANKSIRKTLRPCPEESKNWDTTENLYIEGDNLEVLKLLQESYLGKVKMIYIDPPYNTGSDSFVYPDDYGISKDDYDSESGAVDDDGNVVFKQNSRTNPRYHSKWCSMIYERLMIARNLLSDEGAIFIHIDEHEVYTLEMMCNEIFGVQNELGTIVWDKRNPKGVVAGVAYQHESILVFSKNISVFAGGSFTKKKEHADAMIAKANSLIKKYGAVTEQVRSEYKDWIKQNRAELSGGESAYSLIDDAGDIYQPVSMAAPDKPETRSHRPLIHPKTGKPCPVPAKGWRFTDFTMDDLIKRNKIEFGADESTQPRQKYFLKENMYEAVSSLLYYGGSDDAMGLPFENPKPVYVAKKLIGSLAKKDEDAIMDFFSGSATTAHAVMELNAEDGVNRRFIMVQYPEIIKEKSPAYKEGYRTICDIGKERIRRAGEQIKLNCTQGGDRSLPNTKASSELADGNNSALRIKNSELDIGFRVLKLDETNMKEVYYSADEINQNSLYDMESNIKEDRTDLDLLFGCLLEWGVPLSLPYTSEKIDGYTVHTYAPGDADLGVRSGLIACFEENIPVSVVETIARRQPIRAVFRDSSFADSPAKINVWERFKLLAPDTSVKVI